MDEQRVMQGGAQHAGPRGIDLSAAALRQAVDHLLAIAAIYDAERRIQFLNRYGLRLSGRTEDQILGRRDEEVFPAEVTDYYLPILQRTYETGDHQRAQLSLPALFGRRTAVIDCLPIHDKDGQLAQVFVVARDTSGHKRLEQRLRDLDRELEQRIEQLTGQLCSLTMQMSQAQEQERQWVAKEMHEHPLQALIAAQIQVGLGRQASGSRAWEFLDQADHTLAEGIRVSRNLIAELNPPIFRDADLSLAMEWLGQWVEEKHRLHVQVTTGENIDVPSEALRTFLFRAGKELLIKVAQQANVPRARLDLAQQGEEVWLTVQYPEVSMDKRNTAEGKTAGNEGALDLSSIRERTAYLGGHLDEVHTPGRGTSIALRLKSGSSAPEAASAPAPAEETPPSTEHAPATPRIRILIADDHRIVRQGLAMVLRNEADIAVVGEADNGQQALEMARQLSPDIVLMDMSMPLMDGVQATERIRRDLPDTHVIGLSMYTEKAIMARMRAAGVSAYVNKGGDPAELLRIVRQIVGR